jgi:hypothetical protein
MQLTPEQIALLGLPKGSTVTLSIEPPKTKKWEPKSVNYGYTFSSNFKIINSCHSTPVISLFPSPMLAEDACNAITSYLRQLAWLRENDDGWVDDWNNHNQIKHRITYDCIREKWVIQQAYVTYTPGVIYMSKPTAEKLVDLLNSGIVEL